MNGYAIINVSNIFSGGVSIIDKLNQDYVTYSTDMNTIYQNYLSITQRVTISTAAPSGGSDGDIWFRVSA
jgi:Na+-transporting NADH:ubiquinone oxidoreductase subunit NqrA